MATPDNGDLAGSIEVSRTGKPVREIFPVKFDRPGDRMGPKDFRPRPVTDESPTSPPVETPEVTEVPVGTGAATMREPEPVQTIELHPVTAHPSILPPA